MKKNIIIAISVVSAIVLLGYSLYVLFVAKEESAFVPKILPENELPKQEVFLASNQ